MLDQDYLRSKLNYDPSSGHLFWKAAGGKKKLDIPAGKINWDGYRRISIDGKCYMAHKLVWLYIYGEMPTLFIDHLNHNRDDNKVGNLRLVSLQENQKNRSKQSNNMSGVNGVCWDSQTNKWIVRIKNIGKTYHLGRFSDFFEAVAVRKSANLSHKFHFNHGE